MNVVFMGTPEFAVPHLQHLMTGKHNVLGVVTRPDRPAGRGHALTPPPVKTEAQRYGLPVWQPAALNDESFKEQMVTLRPDAICVVAYGAFLPAWLLSLPAFGCINVHPSLLPRYRGAAPIQRAIMNGDTETGLSTMFMVEAMDAGDVILQQTTPIQASDDAGTLHETLSRIGAELLHETMDMLATGHAPRHVQDESLVTLAPRITEADTPVNWQRSAEEIDAQVRGLRPRPGAYTTFEGRRLKIWRTAVDGSGVNANTTPGTIIHCDDNGVVVATGKGTITLLEVQPENRRPVAAADFVNGYRIVAGDLFA